MFHKLAQFNECTTCSSNYNCHKCRKYNASAMTVDQVLPLLPASPSTELALSLGEVVPSY